jgi:hypothetical protein
MCRLNQVKRFRTFGISKKCLRWPCGMHLCFSTFNALTANMMIMCPSIPALNTWTYQMIIVGYVRKMVTLIRFLSTVRWLREWITGHPWTWLAAAADCNARAQHARRWHATFLALYSSFNPNGKTSGCQIAKLLNKKGRRKDQKSCEVFTKANTASTLWRSLNSFVRGYTPRASTVDTHGHCTCDISLSSWGQWDDVRSQRHETCRPAALSGPMHRSSLKPETSVEFLCCVLWAVWVVSRQLVFWLLECCHLPFFSSSCFFFGCLNIK